MSEPNDKYTERAKAERDALTGLFKEIIKDNDKFRYSIYDTPDETKSKYDCLVKQFSKQTGELIKKMFFEVKIRGAYYDTLLVEKQKLDSMKKLIRDLDKDRIYYVNFTPRNTIIFDLLKLESEGKLMFVKHNHNKTTVEKELGKVEKEVAYIDNADGKAFDYVYVPAPVQTENPTSLPITQLSETEEEDLLANVQVPDPNQVTLELPEEKKWGVRLDADGQIIYSSMEEFKRYPLSIQNLYVAQNRIRRWLKPGEDRQAMIDTFGGEIELSKFLWKRANDELLSKLTVTKSENKEEETGE
jgi:hypothetical protein